MITDTGSTPALMVAQAEVVEGGTLQFVVTLSSASAAEISFTWQTYDSTATGGSDFTTVGATTATIPALAQSITLAVASIQDTTYEGLETLTVSMSSPVNATISIASGLGYIHNDDCPSTGWCQQSYLKAENLEINAYFGQSGAVSVDTIVVGAHGEDSDSGGAYVFKRMGTDWVQEAALKAADPIAGDKFGYSSSISGDTVVVGAIDEDSVMSGVLNGTGGAPGTGADGAGAAYVFRRSGGSWVQEATLKAADPEAGDSFGSSSSVSGDTIVIGARNESSNLSGVINGTGGPGNLAAVWSGAAYVFRRTGNTWVQEAALKAADPRNSDTFGISSSISGDTIVVGADSEDSSLTGVMNGTGGPGNTSAFNSGAAYVFRRTGVTWVQEAAFKAGDASASDEFGSSSAISGDTIVVGANGEGSSLSGVINGTGGPGNTLAVGSGAAYVFRRTGVTWVQEAALKSADPVGGDQFGVSSAISGDIIVVGANGESSSLSVVINGTGDSSNGGAVASGAAYVFRRTGNTWVQEAALKASDPQTNDRFGWSTGVNGDTIIVGARYEDSSVTGVINAPYGSIDNGVSNSGAAYVFYRKGPVYIYIAQASTQADPTTTFPVTFTVEFSKAIDPATFNTADIVQTGTATGVNWTITNSGDDRHFSLTATSSTTNGTIIPTIPTNSVVDVDGNNNLVSSPNFDNSVTKAP